MMDGISIGVGVKNAAMKKGLAEAQKSVGQFRADVGKKLGSTLKAGFAAGAIAGGTFGIVLDRLLDKYDAIAKGARKAGIDPEDYQRQLRTFEMAGVSMEQYTTAVAKMGVKAQQAAEGSKELGKAFADLGINVNDFIGLTPDERMLALAEAFSKSSDKGKAQAAMFKILEESAANFFGIFAQGADAIRKIQEEMEGIVPKKTLENIEKFNDYMKELKENAAAASVAYIELMLNAQKEGARLSQDQAFSTIAKQRAKESGRTYEEELAAVYQEDSIARSGMSYEDANRTEEERRRIMEENAAADLAAEQAAAEEERNMRAAMMRSQAARSNDGEANLAPLGDSEAVRQLREMNRALTDGIRIRSSPSQGDF